MRITNLQTLTPVPQPAQPTNGEDAVTYYLTADTAVIVCDSSGNPKSPGTNINVNAWYKRGVKSPQPLVSGGSITFYRVDAYGNKSVIAPISGGQGYLVLQAGRAAGGRAVVATLKVQNVEVHTLTILMDWESAAPRGIVNMQTESCACSSDNFSEQNMSSDGWQLNAALAPLTTTYPYRFERMLIYYSDAPSAPVRLTPILTGSLGVDGVGAYMLNLTNDMDTVGLTQIDGQYYPADGYSHIYTDFDLCGAPNAEITYVEVWRGGTRLAAHATDAEESITSDEDSGIWNMELRDGSLNIYFDEDVARVPGSKLFLEIRARVVVTEAGNNRTIKLTKVWPILFAEPGQNGISPVVYQLKPEQSFVKYDPNDTSPRPASVGFYCNVLRRFGEGFTEMSRTELQEAGLTVYYDTGDGEVQGDQFFAVPRNLSRLVWVLRNGDNEIIDREEIPVIREGKDGIPGGQGGKGDRGAVIRGPQIWSDVPEGFLFQNGGEGCSFIDIVIYGASPQYYYCTTSHVKSATPPSGDAEHWAVGDKFDLVATKLLLARKGKINNLQVDDIDIFYDESCLRQMLRVCREEGLYICNKQGQQVFGLDTDGNIVGNNIKINNADVTGRVTASSGKIAGFKISGNTLTNDGENDACVDMVSPDGNAVAAFGSNVISAIFGGIRAVGRLLNYVPEPWSGTTNYGLELGVRGATKNCALRMLGGYVSGFNMKNKLVSSSVTLDREDYNIITTNNSNDITITLPIMNLYDDGHVIRIKRMGSGGVKIAMSNCYTPNAQSSSGYRYGKPYLIYNQNSWLTGTETLSIGSVCDSFELVWVRDLAGTKGNTTYYGAWVQYKLPRDW